MPGSCQVHESSSKWSTREDSARNGEEGEYLLDVHGVDYINKEARSHDYNQTLPTLCWKKTKWMVMVLITLLVLVRRLFIPLPPHPNQTFVGGKLRSNGTHDFKRTVVLVSIDGFRADYLDRGLTPHLRNVSKQGIRAKFMRPIFPVCSPFQLNHWTLMTGLYAESHGIVANNFWDPASRSEFHYSNVKSWQNASWWFGEPMWETARRAGLITANLMWLGPTKTSSGVESTYFVPWKDNVPLKEKLDQIISWVDLPLHKRPQLILGSSATSANTNKSLRRSLSLAYDQSLDHAGHTNGPMSVSVNRTLQQVDGFARDLHAELQARNLTDIVDTIFVSDHGMTDTSHPEFIYMDDILGADGVKMIEHEDGWPSMGLRFRPEANETHYLQTLIQASEANGHKFDVYTHKTMPKRYRFSNSDRIAPIYVVPKIGYALTTYEQGTAGMSTGNHGYDNLEPSMRAIFIAHGPFSAVAKALQRSAFSAFHFLSCLNVGKRAVSDDAHIVEGFQNVELYNLVIKLLGTQQYAAKNNGTSGFWDKYF
ncbi:Phosphodiest-domain-containing protein [Pleurotus eryngii]|uniref:Phosphodiest-domain-containing protein n=1 Tax=Pleurotus eryngii TaxID=5323 RepID=A0A9P6D5E5_PLEER|nr:Phosphodiest-domain-containing protein [Pleurotus eryngii]